jgi:rod shape-determining protein MreD
MNRGAPWWLIISSFLVGLIAEVIVIPQAWEFLRPALIALMLVYWTLETPDSVGLGTAFALGLMCDVISLGYLGENAIRFCLLVYATQYFRNQLRFFPVWQQAVVIGFAMSIDLLLRFVLRFALDAPLPGVSDWLRPVFCVLIWPFLYLLLDSLRMRWRTNY